MQVTHQEVSGLILAQYEFKGSELDQLLRSFFALSFHLININVSFPLTTSLLSRCLQLKDIKSCLFKKEFDKGSSSQVFEVHVNRKKRERQAQLTEHYAWR